jgi:hypothetical protein
MNPAIWLVLGLSLKFVVSIEPFTTAAVGASIVGMGVLFRTFRKLGFEKMVFLTAHDTLYLTVAQTN